MVDLSGWLRRHSPPAWCFATLRLSTLGYVVTHPLMLASTCPGLRSVKLNAINDAPVFPQVPTFRLPMNAMGGVVMVAAGTGLAPCRGFIQQRLCLLSRGPVGPCILIFGCRSPADFICK